MSRKCWFSPLFHALRTLITDFALLLPFKNASAFLLRDARHAKHDIFLLRISAILPEAISDGGLTPTTDTDLLLATYRGGSHFTSDINWLTAFRHISGTVLYLLTLYIPEDRLITPVFYDSLFIFSCCDCFLFFRQILFYSEEENQYCTDYISDRLYPDISDRDCCLCCSTKSNVCCLIVSAGI